MLYATGDASVSGVVSANGRNGVSGTINRAGGAAAGGGGGSGGGILIQGESVTLNIIEVNGGSGGDGTADNTCDYCGGAGGGGGGGSGGDMLIEGRVVTARLLDSRGGKGGNGGGSGGGWSGGGGGGGRIRILSGGSPAVDAHSEAGGSAGAGGFPGSRGGDGSYGIQLEAKIDVKPGSYPNAINLRNKKSISVAVLSTPQFDAVVEIDKASLTFGRIGNELSVIRCGLKGEDVNGDGLLDLVCHVDIQKTGFSVGDKEGVLRSSTLNGLPIVGRDSVWIIKA